MEAILWPVYIDSAKTQKEGRKISREQSVKDPQLKEIFKAARKLKLNPKTENDKSYPNSWWENSGRVIIEIEEISKNEALKKISSTIKNSRQNRKIK
jgi:signal recognition particle subunit SRP19